MNARPQPEEPGRARPDERLATSELLKRLAQDTGELIRQEIDLAKLELRESARALALNAAAMATGIGLAVAGGLTLVAFLVIGLGLLLGGAYWLSSLLVGIVLVGVGAALVARSRRRLGEEPLTPERTRRTLKEDGRWAKREASEFRRDITA